jgi:hypothetical protein
MPVVATVVFGGSRRNLVPSQVAIRRVVAWVGDTSVEALLPEGGRRLQLPCSGGSSVSGVHADGGTPDGDFTKEGRGRVAARRCPHRLRAVLGGVASNLSGEANHQLGPRGQIHAPNGMIMKRFRYAGKPGERSRVGRCCLWEAPVEHGGHVAGGVEFAILGGYLQMEEWMLLGLSRQSEQMCPQRRPGRFAGEFGDDLVGFGIEHLNELGANQLLSRDLEPVGVALDSVEQPGSRVAEVSQQRAG